jgi:DNA-binding transcriptional ArsR family regulator
MPAPLNKTPTDPLSAAFAALADPTRRAILARLALGETSVGDLIKPFPISGPAISRHLRVLENARLIERKVDAQWRICRLHPPGLQVANDWLSQYREYWEQRLDRLVDVLEQGEGLPPAPPPSTAAIPRVARKPGTRHARTSSNTASTRKRKSP